MPADLHVHTPLCRHAVGLPQEYVERALSKGLSVLGISDHAPQLPEPYDDWRMLVDELPQYYSWVEQARKSANEKLEVLIGLECDWIEGGRSWSEQLADVYQWDYLIGSVHYIGNRFDFDNPKWQRKWANCDVKDYWEDYWRRYTDMARSGLFQIMGHPDLIKKFGYRPDGDLRKYYEPAIEAIASAGSAIEINTAGWHKPCCEQYPAMDFLQLAFQAGIPLTINSDAHAPGEVARDREKAILLAEKAGYTSLAYYRKQLMVEEPMNRPPTAS